MDDDYSDQEAMENVSITNFWGTKLSSKSKVYEYTGESDLEEDIETMIEIKGACLGADAKNERNIVDITTDDAEGNPVTFSIFSLKLDKLEQVSSYLTLQPPFKLELVQGSGPVSVTGNIISTLNEDKSDDEDASEDEEEEEVPSLTKVEKNTLQKKRPADSPVEVKPAKKKRRNMTKEPIDEEDDSDEEDSAMDASFELTTLNDKGSDDDDNDDEEDDEEDTEEDDDSDDDDEEEEEEESEEEEIKPPPKMSAKSSKGQPQKKSKGGLDLTPAPSKKSTKLSVKEPMSAPKSEGKKGSKNTLTPSIDQIKKKLLASPTLPKKMEKFSNMLKNNYKISDDNARKELWEYVQKNKK